MLPPRVSYSTALSAALRLVVLIRLGPVDRLLELEGKRVLCRGVFCVCLGFALAFSLGFALRFPPWVLEFRKLGLEGFDEDLKINALVDMDFCNAFGWIEGNPYEVGALVFDRVFGPRWGEILVLEDLFEDCHRCSHGNAFDSIPDRDLWLEEQHAVAARVQFRFFLPKSVLLLGSTTLGFLSGICLFCHSKSFFPDPRLW